MMNVKVRSGKSTIFGLSKFQCLVLVELLLLFSMTLSISSVFVPNWLQSEGDQFLFPRNTTQGFSTRQYGLIYVEGLRIVSWAELATNTCDQWGMYTNSASLFPVAPVCNNSPVNAATCTENFETHLRARCDSYSAITLVSWVTLGLLSFSALLVAITSIAMLVVPLGQFKRYVLAALCSSCLFSLPVLVAWGVLTYIYFHKLTTTATYPTPTPSVGAVVALGGSVLLITATLVFWRLSKGLKAAPEGSKLGVSNAGLLDMAEHKFLGHKDGTALLGDSDGDQSP